MSDNKEKLLIKARQLVLLLEQNIDDEDPLDDELYMAIDSYIDLTRSRCANCNKKMPQDQIDIGYLFCCDRCEKEYFIS